MVNKVILIGNVGADPEVRYLEGGVAVANLRLATTERYKNKNGKTSIRPSGITSYYGEDWLKSSKSMSKKECVFISKDGFVPVPGTTRME